MALIPDINATEKWLIENTPKERCGDKVDYQQADAEISLQPSEREFSERRLIHRARNGCHFTISRIGICEYDDLAECAVSLLQALAGHESARRGDIQKIRR